MSAPDATALAVGLAFFVLLVNLAWLGISGRHFTRRYLPDLTPLTLIWASTLIGAVVIYIGSLHAHSVLLPAGTALFTLGWMSMLSDMRSRRLPNVVTFMMGAEALAALAITSLLSPVDPTIWLNALAGATLWTVVIGLGWYLKQMGLGDLKLAPVLGFILGCGSWMDAGVALVLAFLIAGLYGISTRFRHPAKTRIPFGPAMLTAAMTIWALRAMLGPVPLQVLGT